MKLGSLCIENRINIYCSSLKQNGTLKPKWQKSSHQHAPCWRKCFAVARTFGASRKGTRLLRERYLDPGTVKDRPRGGRPRVTTPAQDRFIRTAHLRNYFRTATDTARQFPGLLPISQHTVHRRLKPLWIVARSCAQTAFTTKTPSSQVELGTATPPMGPETVGHRHRLGWVSIPTWWEKKSVHETAWARPLPEHNKLDQWPRHFAGWHSETCVLNALLCWNTWR